MDPDTETHLSKNFNMNEWVNKTCYLWSKENLNQPIENYEDCLIGLTELERATLSAFAFSSHVIQTNNGSKDSQYKSYRLNSHMIFRQKNHIDLKEKIIDENNKFKVPRDIRND